MAIKKSELYSSLWKSCDELRGGMDASQYKDYVLVLLFLKYISDKYANQPYAPITIPDGASFADMVKLKGNPHIGDLINKQIIAPIVDKNRSLQGTIDNTNFNSDEKLGAGREKVEKLGKLIAIFENPLLDFSRNKAGGDDILGDAYEYLMQHFARDSGKSKGQFYTPAEVSRIIASIIGITPKNSTAKTTVYDPTCGSGSLLLKVADRAEKSVSLYGQEMDVSTAGLAKMNLLLHGQNSSNIKQGNTLADPKHTEPKNSHALIRFDYVVANPPFSAKSWTNGVKVHDDVFGRFTLLGTAPPEKNGDYAFLLHILTCMNSTGKGAVILPHGVLFRGNAEAAIRKQLIEKGWLAGIIGLPANLFYGTGIPACILLLDKENATPERGVFMMDASAGFKKDGNKNRLREQDIHRMVDVFNARKDVPHYARLVPVEEIREKDYNLNLPRYIERAATEPLHDLQAHLTGGIPLADVEALQHWWTHLPGLRRDLFAKTDHKNYLRLRVPAHELRQTIAAHPDMQQLLRRIETPLNHWLEEAAAVCRNFETKFVPPAKLAHHLGETLLHTMQPLPLIDAYMLYDLFMVYWQEVMMDDAYLLAADGWLAARRVEWEMSKPAKGSDKAPKPIRYDGVVLPKELVLRVLLPQEEKHLQKLKQEAEQAAALRDEYEEEHSGEESLLNEARNDNGSLTDALAKARLKEIKHDKQAAPERKALAKWLELSETATTTAKALKAEEKRIDELLLEEIYPNLTEETCKRLVVNEKWIATLRRQFTAETERLSRTLAAETELPAQRYAQPLAELEKEAKKAESKVKAHLRKLGLTWA